MGFKENPERINTAGKAPGTKANRTILRELMEENADEIVMLFKKAIIDGELDGKKLSVKARTDLMKSFMPYVLPQLRSVEVKTETEVTFSPLVIKLDPSVKDVGHIIEHDNSNRVIEVTELPMSPEAQLDLNEAIHLIDAVIEPLENETEFTGVINVPLHADIPQATISEHEIIEVPLDERQGYKDPSHSEANTDEYISNFLTSVSKTPAE